MIFQTADTYFRRRIEKAGVPAALITHVDGPSLVAARTAKPPAGGVTLPARVNHGRWIVDCPFCSSAQYASPTDPRFFCADCLNVSAGGAWVAVTFPAARQGIETALALRPRLATMNWTPGETVADLHRENQANGVE